MTVYISSMPSTLVGYYLREFKNTNFNLEVCANWNEVLNISTRCPTLDEDMELVPSINVVIPSFDKPGKELRHSVLNDTYIVGVKIDVWRPLIKKYSWIEPLKIDLTEYDRKVNKLKDYLDTSAFKWFKNSFYNYPLKVQWETIHILIKCQEVNRKLDIEDLEIMYGFGKTYEFYNYSRNLGNQTITNNILTRLDNTTLWLGFVGKNTPFIYKELMKRCPESWMLVDIFRTLFIKGRVNLSPGVFIVNYLLNLVLNSKDREGNIDMNLLKESVEFLESL